MANYRNEFEFRSGLLDALGVEHTEADAKVEERWRAKMLDGLGVEYNQNDVNQFDLFRAKLVEGVEGYSGGSGTSYTTLFEGSVTTVEVSGGIAPEGILEGVSRITADTIKVTFNGVEYTCPKLSDDSYGAPYDEGTDSLDFSEYPFSIYYKSLSQEQTIATQTAGTYTLKIEAPQSGGSSDFSTAEVTFSVVNDTANAPIGIVIDISEALSYTMGDAVNDDDKLVYVLYKGSQTVSASDTAQITVEGNANIVEQVEDDGYWYAMINITGDCTINLTGGGEV